MKRLLGILFLGGCSFLACQEKTTPIDAQLLEDRSKAFGSGEHFKFSLDEWNGEEKLISRLAKDNETFCYLRVSEQEFNIQKQDPKPGSESEILFKFFLTMPAMAPDLSNAALVDVLHEKDQVAALMVSNRGYFYLRSSSEPPRVAPPKHFIPIRKLGKWMPQLMVSDCDFYWDSPNEAALPFEKVSQARLAGLNQIEFVPIEKEDSENPPDVFQISDTGVTKNGKPFKFKHFPGPTSQLGIIEEITFSERLSKMDLEEFRETMNEQEITKEDLMEVVDDFQNRKIAASVEHKLNSAFP